MNRHSGFVHVFLHRGCFARFCMCLLIGLAPQAAAAEPEPGGNAALNEAFQALNALELGQSLDTFQPIDQAVAQARADQGMRADLETRLIAVLQGNATDLAKDYACRQLAIVGADASTAALAPLLPNPRLSHMARHALEGIASPAAIRSLREMLGKTEGRQRIGVAVSLGRLADGEAAAAIAALLGEENQELREAALVALGRIGTVQAAASLAAFQAPESLRSVHWDAQLNAVESLCRRGEHKAAAGICEPLLTVDSERVRAAAFRGLVAAKPSASLDMIREALAADEPWKRAVAADCVAALNQPDQIAAIASAVPQLPAAGKIAALVSLRGHGHAAVRAAALAALEEQETEVRTAALTALVASATPADVPTLAGIAAKAEEPPVRQAAFDTLRLMPAAGTHEAMIPLIGETTDLQPLVVRCALARRSPALVPALLKAAESPNEAARREALKALEILATATDAESLVRLLCKASPGEQREAADRAVWKSCQQIADPSQRSAPLLAVLEKADAAEQSAILPSLARIGGEKALAAVRSAMASPDPIVRDAGYRALANWPDATVAEELLEIAKSSEVESYRVWSLRAYARVVALPSDRPPQQTFQMLDAAMKLASRVEDQELIVSRLAAVRVPDALARLVSLLDDAHLKNAAVPAVFTLAKGLSQSHPDQAKAALVKIQPLTADPALMQQIPKVLRDIDARKQGQNP